MKLVALFLLVPSLAIAEPKLLDELEATYAKAKHLHATFKQTNTYAVYSTTKTKTGRVILAREGKMRWDYDDPKKKGNSFIYDGKTLWVVEPKKLQVMKHTALDPSLPAAIGFLNGSSALTKQYDVTSPAADTLVLVPRTTNAKVKQVTFVVDAKTKRVARSTVENHNGDTTTYEFTSTDLEKQPDAKAFEFSPKSRPAFKVVDIDDEEAVRSEPNQR